MKGFVRWKIGPTHYLPIPTFHCSICGHNSESFSICLKCEPQTYEVDMPKIIQTKVIDTLADDWDLTSAIAVHKPTWNTAIEAALKIIEQDMTDAYRNVERLKK